MKGYTKAIAATAIALFALAGDASAQFWNLNGNTAGVSDFIGTTNSNPFRIYTNNAERLRIDASGNMGVGTNNPLRALHVYEGNQPQIKLTDALDEWEVWGGFDLVIRRQTGVSSYTEWLRCDSIGRNIQMGPSDELFISVNTGNVGLGTSNVHDKLTVNGSITPYSDCTFAFGRSGRRWSAIHARVGTINTSDARLKENIQDLRYGLEEVMKLRPVSFTWKDDAGYGTKLGLLAQEVQPVISEVVKTGDEGNMGLCYDDLLPVLVKAVQQQQGTLTAETEEQSRLRSELAEQERRIVELERELGITD